MASKFPWCHPEPFRAHNLSQLHRTESPKGRSLRGLLPAQTQNIYSQPQKLLPASSTGPPGAAGKPRPEAEDHRKWVCTVPCAGTGTFVLAASDIHHVAAHFSSVFSGPQPEQSPGSDSQRQTGGEETFSLISRLSLPSLVGSPLSLALECDQETAKAQMRG